MVYQAAPFRLSAYSRPLWRTCDAADRIGPVKERLDQATLPRVTVEVISLCRPLAATDDLADSLDGRALRRVA